MLDDESHKKLGRSLVAVLGAEFFVWSKSVRGRPNKTQDHSFAYDLRKIQELQQRSGIWKLIFAIRDPADQVLYERLCEFSLSFIGTLSFEANGRNHVQETIAAADLVYAPGFCSLNLVRPTMTPPSSSDVAMGIITYFSITMAPFSAEEYRKALLTYDPTAVVSVA